MPSTWAASSASRADKESWALERHIVEYVIDHWREPDEGIWEVRGPRRHFTHSKVFAWVAIDRAVRAVEKFGLEGLGRANGARCATRSAPRCSTKASTPSARRSPSTTARSELDASLLMLPLVHFLPATDERMRGTVAAIKGELMRDGLVLRYRSDQTDDGLPPGEGTFLACTFWLVDNLALLGELEEATEIFERLLSLRNDVGLLAEQYDPELGRMLGNFPQALTHVGLVTSAYNLDRARNARARALRSA